jgi:hypothetical protein
MEEQGRIVCPLIFACFHEFSLGFFLIIEGQRCFVFWHMPLFSRLYLLLFPLLSLPDYLQLCFNTLFADA